MRLVLPPNQTLLLYAKHLTAAMEGLCVSPGLGCVTSAPNTITGSENSSDLQISSIYTCICVYLHKCQHRSWLEDVFLIMLYQFEGGLKPV